jgi:alkylation response protein AidB-like acyl-CoA dehydrogenase
MDLSLTEEQELLKRVTHDFVQREFLKETILELEDARREMTPELWAQASEMGWLGMLIPTEYGGSGNSFTDAAVVFEELGRGPVPGPFFSSGVLAALTIAEGGTDKQKSEILPNIASGDWAVSVAVTEPDYGWTPEFVGMGLTSRNGSYSLSGTKLFVQDAGSATHFLCAVRSGQDVVFAFIDAQAPGVSARALDGFIASMYEVTFDKVEVVPSALLAEGWLAFERAALKALPILCAYQVGGMQTVFNMAVDHSQNRVQFGRPIGRFQRVQDHIIRLVNHLDSARWTTYEALWKLDAGRDPASSVHMAKAVTAEAYVKACDATHEVLAGIGIDRGYGLTLHSQMSRTLYGYLGDPKYHKRRLGDALGL